MLETRGIVADENVFTTLAFVTFDDQGDRKFSFARKPGADTCLRFEELDLSLIDQAKVFHFGTLSLTDEPVKTATEQAIRYAKERGKWITFDPICESLCGRVWTMPERPCFGDSTRRIS